MGNVCSTCLESKTTKNGNSNLLLDVQERKEKMVKWWDKAMDKVEDWCDDVGEKIEDAATDLVDGSVDLVKQGDCYQTVAKLHENGTECYQLAMETTQLCTTTKERSDKMIADGDEIVSTLRGFSQKMDIETLETIKDLMDGDQLRESMQLCQEMDDIALSCIDKSARMIQIMEDTMDTVPKPLQKIINKMAGQDDAVAVQQKERGLEVLSTLDEDMEDVKACIDALKHLHISTALTVGTRAFESLSQKAIQSRDMFVTMKCFSEEVAGYTEAINDKDVGDMFKLAAKMKDMWHCLKLASFMRQLAEGAGKMIRVLIDLFGAMSDRLATLWAALAYAKDCMVDCIEYVVQATDVVLKARDDSTRLIERSKAVWDTIQDLGDFNKESLVAARKLNDGDDINEAVKLASNMDDLVLECTDKVVLMVKRVTEGFQNLPDIITADIVDEDDSDDDDDDDNNGVVMSRDIGNIEFESRSMKHQSRSMAKHGKNDDDPEPDDIEENVKELDAAAEVIETENVIVAAKASVDGFRSVMDNEDNCENMLSLVEGFAGDCRGTIDSFLGVWDLESAMEKISEMCRVVRLGEMIKRFAENIKRLLKSIIRLMKSMIDKITLENLTGIDVGDMVDDIGDFAKDKFDDVKGKLQFWKKK